MKVTNPNLQGGEKMKTSQEKKTSKTNAVSKDKSSDEARKEKIIRDFFKGMEGWF